MKTYAHMCRMDHVEIGHNESGDDERCPLCQALDKIYWLEADIARYRLICPSENVSNEN